MKVREIIKEIATTPLLSLALCELVEHYTIADIVKATRWFFQNPNDCHSIGGLINGATDGESISEYLKYSPELYNSVAMPRKVRAWIDEKIIESAIRVKVPKVPKPPSRKQVYLIENTRNGLFKIGMSNNPIKRENTLASQEPDIKLIAFGKGGRSLEMQLHVEYASLRVRGEWFRLSDDNVEEVRSKLEETV